MASFNRQKAILLLLVISLTSRGTESVYETDFRCPVAMYQDTRWSNISLHSHQLMHFQCNNILVKMLTLKHVRTLRHVSILTDHHQGVRRCLVKVTGF